MKKVLIIGAGKRALGATLPALGALRDEFEVVGVLARSERDLTPYGIRTQTNLKGIDIPSLSLIIVGPTVTEVPRVLEQLSAFDTSTATLLLDTPVLPPKGLPATRYFGRYRAALAAEDTIALPPHRLARALIKEGAIGELTDICFFHNGYRFHGLASLKMLAGEDISSVRLRRYANGIERRDVRFPSSVRAFMYEPRDYENCSFLIKGTKGAITDLPGHSSHVIGYVSEAGVYQGLTLNGVTVAPDALDLKYREAVSPAVPGISLMNSMKIRGLMELLRGAVDETSPLRYTAREAIADNLLAILSERFGSAPNLLKK